MSSSPAEGERVGASRRRPDDSSSASDAITFQRRRPGNPHVGPAPRFESSWFVNRISSRPASVAQSGDQLDDLTASEATLGPRVEDRKLPFPVRRRLGIQTSQTGGAARQDGRQPPFQLYMAQSTSGLRCATAARLASRSANRGPLRPPRRILDRRRGVRVAHVRVDRPTCTRVQFRQPPPSRSMRGRPTASVVISNCRQIVQANLAGASTNVRRRPPPATWRPCRRPRRARDQNAGPFEPPLPRLPKSRTHICHCSGGVRRLEVRLGYCDTTRSGRRIGGRLCGSAVVSAAATPAATLRQSRRHPPRWAATA